MNNSQNVFTGISSTLVGNGMSCLEHVCCIHWSNYSSWFWFASSL